jgi:hypothetical protein
MIEELLAAAKLGQARPSLAERLDLIRGGLRIRLRPGGALSDADGWRDAPAVFSVAAPVLLLTATGVSLLWDHVAAQFSLGWLVRAEPDRA